MFLECPSLQEEFDSFVSFGSFWLNHNFDAQQQKKKFEIKK